MSAGTCPDGLGDCLMVARGCLCCMNNNKICDF